MSEQPFIGTDEVEAHLRSAEAAPVSDSRWTTGEDVDAHLKSRFARSANEPAVDGRTYPDSGDDDVEGHPRAT